jgi:outer membrane protein assembly factor BamD
MSMLNSCSSNQDNVKKIKQKDLDLQMIDAYNEALKALGEGDTLFASEKFNEAELLFPQSEWAPKAALMSAYSYYSDGYYSDAIYELERIIKTYPKNKDIAYAHFLLGMCHYDSIVDEQKDMGPLVKAKEKFEYVEKNYPGTDFSLDAKYKLELIKEIMAAKEMYIAKYYFELQKWIPAINRYKIVINEYSRTIYIEEALHRMVEIHYTLGLEDEAKKYAKLLGYNYQSSRWYKQSYGLFEENYTKNSIEKNPKKKEINLIQKFKNLFE